MGRARVIYTKDHPYHVMARLNNKEWFKIPINYCFGVYANVLEECVLKYKIKIHAFVLMNNHYHLIVSTPELNISYFLRYFMSKTSKAIAKKAGVINHIYGGRNYKCVIDNSEYYAHCLKYVYRNPVKAGLCSRVEDYPWSSISKSWNKIKKLETRITLGHEEYLPQDLYTRLAWFNEPSSEEVDRVISRGLTRSIFEPKTDLVTKKRVDFSSQLSTHDSTV